MEPEKLKKLVEKKHAEVKSIVGKINADDFNKGSKVRNIFENIDGDLSTYDNKELLSAYSTIIYKMKKKNKKSANSTDCVTNNIRRSDSISSDSISSNSISSDSDMLEYIPKKLKYYITRNINTLHEDDFFVKAYSGRMNVLLEGETGSGKTMGIRNFAANNDLPYARVNLNGSTTPEDLIGQFVATENGNFAWVDGLMTKFIRHGGVFVADEINACPPEMNFMFQSILDDERQIVLVGKDGEVIKAHPDFMFFATMNPDYEGTGSLNVSLRDRFDAIISWNYDDKVDLKVSGGNRKLVMLAEHLRQSYYKTDLSMPISTRAIERYVRHVELFGADFAKQMMINKFSSPAEKKLVQEAFELIMEKPEEVNI